MCDSALVINKQELQKISLFYENRTIKEIMDIYRSNCEVVKNNLTEARFDFESNINLTIIIYKPYLAEISEDESSLIKISKHSDFNQQNTNSKEMNTSYKVVNDRIVKLKKFEFFFYNITVRISLIKLYRI